MSENALRLSLVPADAPLAAHGRPVEAIAPASAALRFQGEEVQLTVALPSLSRAEQRWVVDQVVRKVTALTPPKRVVVEADSAIDDDTALTLALDRRLAVEATSLCGRDALTERFEALSRALGTYRTWVDEEPTVRTSLAIAADVQAFGQRHDDVEVTVLDESALASEGLRLLLAVGGASRISPPRLVIARYKPTDPRPARMLVGKGITFDSGGINVKPYESFVSMMRNDMAGAALAFTLFRTLVERGHDEPLCLVLPTCENPIGEEAMRPGSVVESHRGLKVRIDHTDAEGRLVLADALSYATALYPPREVFTFATLTTAALIAYGPYETPVHFATDDCERLLRAAAAETGEDLCFFPTRVWHREANRDRMADLKNTASLPSHASRGAGSRNAGHFLRFFTDAPLTHLDIFASTWNWAGDAPGAGAGSTGAPLRTLLRAWAGL
jgi:leucyl aminopeptidase